MSIGDPTHSAYYGCWNDGTNGYCAYMKVDGSNSEEIQAFRITSNLPRILKLTEHLQHRMLHPTMNGFFIELIHRRLDSLNSKYGSFMESGKILAVSPLLFL